MSIDSFVMPIVPTFDTTTVQIWLISNNHLFEEESDAFLKQHKISVSKVKSYNLNDTCKSFTCLDINQWDNIVNHLFNTDKPIRGLSGLPFSLIADKSNHLLAKDTTNPVSQEKVFLPLQLHEINSYNTN